MSGKYVYLVLCCVMLSAHSYQRIKTVCEQSSCLYLYESDNPFIPWDGSRRVCTDEGLEMLSIESSQTQTTVDRLLQDLPPITLRQVWIGGRGSSDDIWRYMNGTEFHRPVTFTDSSDSDLNCVQVKLCKDRNPEYQAENCDEIRSTSRVLCQYDKSQTGECRPSDYEFGQQKCYVKTPYDGSQSNRTDWYSGQTYCSQSRIQGDLAYSYLDDTSSMNSVLSLFDDSDGCALLWLGVRRRIWFWRTVSDSDGQPITYFNWFDNRQIQPSYDNCIYVDRDNGNKWRTQNCYNYQRYFICMKVNTTTKSTAAAATTTTATTFTSDVSATTTTPLADNHTTLTQVANCQLFNTYQIAFLTTLLICVMLLAIIIGLTVTFIRYRRRMSSQSSRAGQTTGTRTDDVTHSLATRSPLSPDNDETTSGLRELDIGQVEYEQVTGQGRQEHIRQIGEGHGVELEVNPYEKPSTYINMIDRPNTYEALQ